MKNTLWRLLIIFSFITGIGLSACTTSEPVANENSVTFQSIKVAAANCDYGGEILSVESLDAYSVKFTLCKPDSVFPAKMAAPIFAVQDQDYLNQNAGDSLAMSDTPNGTGAFRLKEWKRAEGMLLEPSSSYWGVPALPATIDFQWRFDAAKRFSFTTMASVDGFDRPPSGMIQYVRPNPELVLLSHEPMNTYYIGMNNTISPFDKPEFRIALAMAIDPSVAVRVAFPEGSEIAHQLVPSNLNPGYSPLIKWYEARPRDATNLLRDADYDFNQELTLAIPNVSMQYLETPSVVANNIIRQLADINVKVTLKIMDPLEFKQSLSEGKEMMYLNWFVADYIDASAFYERAFLRDAIALGDPYTDIQALVDESLAKTDATSRQITFDKLNILVKEQVPLIPLAHAANYSVFRSSVKNISANAYYENYEDVSGVDDVIQFFGVPEPVNMIEVSEPQSLWPADEDDYSTFRVTRLLYDTLLSPGFGDLRFTPLLAESWESNENQTEWTFLLRYNVRFANGASFDANDVVASFSAIWDAADPNHTGRTGEFAMFQRLFGNMINTQ